MVEFVAINLPLDPEARKARARAKALRIDEVAKPNPHTKAEAAGPKVVPDERMKKKRQHARMVEEVRSGVRKVAEPIDPRSDVGAKLRARRVVSDASDLNVVHKSANGVFDLWGERADDIATHEAFKADFGHEEDWFQPSRKKTKLYAEERTADAIKRSGRHAIEIAAPGASYNPDYESHQELLQEALDFYTKKADSSRKQAKLVPRIKQQVEPVVFMDSDNEEEESSESQSDDDQEEAKKENLAHIPRLSKEERRKRERQAKHQSMLRAIERRKEQNRQFTAINGMVRNLDDEERVREAKRQARAEIEEDRKETKIARIGPAHYRHRAPEVLLTEELPGSLRALKPQSSIIEDRFASFQRRNMVETRHKSKRKQSTRDTKEFTRKSFRDAPIM